MHTRKRQTPKTLQNTTWLLVSLLSGCIELFLVGGKRSANNSSSVVLFAEFCLLFFVLIEKKGKKTKKRGKKYMGKCVPF